MTSRPDWWPTVPPPSERARHIINLRQVVAYNLWLARKQRGMTQRDLGELLSQLTGRSWTVGAVSAAEAIWDSPNPRPRSFDVLDLVAFSLALRLPLTWFFLPPPRTPTGDDMPPFLDWIELGKKRTPNEDTDVELLSGRFLANLALAHADLGDSDDEVMSRRLRSISFTGAGREMEDDDRQRFEQFFHEFRELLTKYAEDE